MYTPQNPDRLHARLLGRVLLGLALGCSGWLGLGVATALPLEVQQSVDAREGPGSYYPPVMRLLAGAAVDGGEVQRGWQRLTVDEQICWVPQRSLGAPGSASVAQVTGEADRLQQMLEGLERQQAKGGQSSKKVPWVQVTAAVRGFALSYAASRIPGTPADRTGELSQPVDVSKYEAFLSHRFSQRDRERLARRAPLRDADVPGWQADADRMGMAIANAVSQRGLSGLADVEAYLTHVATLVAESSHVYELPVRVWVLTQQEPVGFIAPNGMMFVSLGALEMMRDEAEFAFFAGHEIAHIALAHGMQGSAADQRRIRESSAFDELDSELGWDDPNSTDRYARTAQELSAMADEIYDVLRSERHETFEHEADAWGMVYAHRAGYVASAAVDLLQRLSLSQTEQGKGIESASRLLWRQTPIKERIRRCQAKADSLTISDSDRRFADEFARARARPRP